MFLMKNGRVFFSLGKGRAVCRGACLVGRMKRECQERDLPTTTLSHSPASIMLQVRKWESVMKVVVHCVNYIRKTGLKHRQFQAFLAAARVRIRRRALLHRSQIVEPRPSPTRVPWPTTRNQHIPPFQRRNHSRAD